MPKPVPTLGYPSITAACQALAASGLKPREIGERVGREANFVTGVLASGKDRLADRKLLLPMKMARALAEEGRARGISAAELVDQLLEVIVRDDLFEALLGELDEVGHG
jgi:hypothetical protein